MSHHTQPDNPTLHAVRCLAMLFRDRTPLSIVRELFPSGDYDVLRREALTLTDEGFFVWFLRALSTQRQRMLLEIATEIYQHEAARLAKDEADPLG